MIAPLIAEETLNNKLSMHSVDDRIEGFARAIVAGASQRMSAAAGAIASNEMELTLGTRLASTVSDFQLFGARNVMGVVNDCELRVTMHHVTGSGQTANTYVDMNGTLGTGNRLIITGNLNAFSHTNQAILPHARRAILYSSTMVNHAFRARSRRRLLRAGASGVRGARARGTGQWRAGKK